MYRRGATTGEKSLTQVNIEKLLNVAIDLKAEVLFRLALTGGLRRDDIIKVLVKDINFDNKSLVFFQKKKRNHHTVYLPQSTILAIKKYTNANRRLRSPFLFPGSDPKKHISSKTAYNIFQRHLKLAGIPPRPFHALRSTCVKLCQARGWTPEQAAKHLDDKVRTIQEHYTTPSEEERKQVAKEKEIL